MLKKREPRSPRIVEIRDMVPDDFVLLQAKAVTRDLVTIRDSHHMIARLSASGLTNVEVARRTGYSSVRVNTLLQAPAMVELVAHYRQMVTDSWKDSTDEYFEYIYTNGMKAQRQISDALDAADEDGATPIPINRLLAIAADSADRVGYTKKSTQVNINVDFASKLEAAIARSRQVRQITVDE